MIENPGSSGRNSAISDARLAGARGSEERSYFSRAVAEWIRKRHFGTVCSSCLWLRPEAWTEFRGEFLDQAYVFSFRSFVFDVTLFTKYGTRLEMLLQDAFPPRTSALHRTET